MANIKNVSNDLHKFKQKTEDYITRTPQKARSWTRVFRNGKQFMFR